MENPRHADHPINNFFDRWSPRAKHQLPPALQEREALQPRKPVVEIAFKGGF